VPATAAQVQQQLPQQQHQNIQLTSNNAMNMPTTMIPIAQPEEKSKW
jgi:hypothetical protein